MSDMFPYSPKGKEAFQLLTREQLSEKIGGAGGISNVVPLTANQINHLFSAPQVIVAAPGVRKAIRVSKIISNIKFGTAPLTDNGDIPRIRYTNASGIIVAGVSFDKNEDDIVELIINGFGGINPSLVNNRPLVLSSTADAINFGNVATAVIGNSPGTGYAINDTFTINTFGGDAEFVVDSIGGGGAVATFHKTVGGSGYSISNNNPTSTSGAGSGLTINITAITPGNGSAQLTIYYSIVPLLP